MLGIRSCDQFGASGHPDPTASALSSEIRAALLGLGLGEAASNSIHPGAAAGAPTAAATPMAATLQTVPVPGLNRSQSAAVAECEAGSSIVVIHGPPGTGKTRTLSHVVMAAVRQHTAWRAHVLLGVATTRVAVDTLGSELCASAHPPRLVRVGELSAAASPELRSRSLDAIVAADARAPQLAALREMHAAASKKKKATKVALEIAKLDRYNDFDIILDHFSRTSRPSTIPHAPHAILYFVPILSGC